MPILKWVFLTFNWLTLTSKMHFFKFHPQVASYFTLQRQRKYAPLGMRLLWKYIRNYFLVYHLTLHFVLYLQNYKEFEAEILDLFIEKYGLSFDIKNVLFPVEPWGLRMWSAYTPLKTSSCLHIIKKRAGKLYSIRNLVVCTSRTRTPWLQKLLVIN